MDYILLERLRNHHPGTYYHSLRVGQLCYQLSQRIYQNAEISLLHMRAGLLHDIGKIFIPVGILSKPGALNEEEMRIIRAHPQQGLEYLQRYDYGTEIIEGIAGHHEREDGSGYPNGGTSHSDIARIVAVCDVFDAMVMDREYRGALPKDQVLHLMSLGRLGALHHPFIKILEQIVGTTDYQIATG